MRRFALATGLVLSLLAAPLRAGELIDIHDAERTISGRLTEVGAAALAREMSDVGPEAPLTARVAHFVALVRADHGSDALGALERLADSPRITLDSVAEWLVGRERDALATRLFELRPDLRTSRWRQLLDRSVERDGLEQALAWVRAREAQEPDTWLPARAWLLRRYGDIGPLLDELEAGVHAAPTDLDRAVRFVGLIQNDEREIAWLADVVQTTGPVEDLKLAGALARVPRAMLGLTRRACERPFGEADRAAMQEVARHVALRFWQEEEPDFEVEFRARARRALLDALRRCDETDEAQALMEELHREEVERSERGLPPAGWLFTAGLVQAASGARFVERAVRAAEEPGQDDPRYWIGRAAYFQGREEWAEVETAANRALTLTEDGTDDFHRQRALEYVCEAAGRSGGNPAKVAVVLAELARLEKNGGYERARVEGPPGLAYGLVRKLAFDLHRDLDPRNEILWRFMEAMPALDYTTERLMRRMAERTPATGRAAFWERAEAVARGGALSGREHLGFVMIVSGDPQRAIPFLRESVTLLPEGEHRARCAFLIVRAGLESGDWRAARDAWTIGRRHLGIDERPSRHVRMALLAAADGAVDDAVAFWSAKARLDAGDLDGLVDLAEAGVRERLVAFYERMAETDPVSDAPRRALAILR